MERAQGETDSELKWGLPRVVYRQISIVHLPSSIVQHPASMIRSTFAALGLAGVEFVVAVLSYGGDGEGRRRYSYSYWVFLLARAARAGGYGAVHPPPAESPDRMGWWRAARYPEVAGPHQRRPTAHFLPSSSRCCIGLACK